MILHIVLFKWKDGVSEAQIRALDAAMAKLPAAIPQVKSLHWGSDVRFRDGNADWGLAALFEDQAGWQAYQVHPEHQAVVQNMVVPLLASRTAIQMPAPAGWKP